MIVYNFPWKSFLLCLFCVFATGYTTYAQDQPEEEDRIIQFSGKVVYEEDGELVGAPYVAIYIKNHPNRGVNSNEEGFFSLPARVGETIVFRSLGFEEAEYTIPDTLTDNRYTLYQILTYDNIVLPEAVIYPWPSREHFEIEFLAMDVTEELREIAEENLARETLQRASEQLLPDADETADLYFQQQAERTYSAGQYRPTNILNPLAWQKFIKAWKEGKFKRQK